LKTLAQQVGLPIDPPRRNVNSRLALETGELVRARAGEAAAAGFHHAISRAFFADGADIADERIVIAQAARYDIDAASVREAWGKRAYAGTVDASIEASFAAGVTGVPAFAWPGSRAVSGMMPPDRIVAILRSGP
jgi:predicted DsbA family dithiol-disulfide isomerase